jgi:hypothetical protein
MLPVEEILKKQNLRDLSLSVTFCAQTHLHLVSRQRKTKFDDQFPGKLLPQQTLTSFL